MTEQLILETIFKILISIVYIVAYAVILFRVTSNSNIASLIFIILSGFLTIMAIYFTML